MLNAIIKYFTGYTSTRSSTIHNEAIIETQYHSSIIPIDEDDFCFRRHNKKVKKLNTRKLNKKRAIEPEYILEDEKDEKKLYLKSE